MIVGSKKPKPLIWHLRANSSNDKA